MAHSVASPLPVLGERGHCLLREHDGAAALHGLRRQELALPQHAPHGQDAPLEVHVLPGESQELPPPEPGGDRHDVEGFVAAATCSLKEGAAPRGSARMIVGFKEYHSRSQISWHHQPTLAS